MSAVGVMEGRPAFQPFQCVVCNSRFTRHENLKRHAALHSRSHNDVTLSCEFCSATFSRPDLRSRHMKRKHPEHEEGERQHQQPKKRARRASKATARVTDRDQSGESPDARRDSRDKVSPLGTSMAEDRSVMGSRHSDDDDGEMEMEMDTTIWPTPLPYERQHHQQNQTQTQHADTITIPTSGPPLSNNSAAGSTIQALADPLTHPTPMSDTRSIEQIVRDVSNSDTGLLLGESFLEPIDRPGSQDHSISMSVPHSSAFSDSLNTTFNFDPGLFDKFLPIDLPHIEPDWFPSALQISRGCDVFFSHVSHFIPFLHEPTFEPNQIPHYLLLSMLCIAYQHSDDPECGGQEGSGVGLSIQCFQRARVLIAADEETDEDSSLTIAKVQTYLLLQIYAMLYLCGTDSAYGLKTHSKMISLARAGGLMQPILAETVTTEDLDALWREFVRAESRKRTLYAVHQIDALWYQFLSIPRSLSHLEIKHDLPCPEDFWAATTSVEWAHRQLVSRQSAPSVQYSEAVRRFLSASSDLTSIPSFDPYGAINITQFLVSSAREISGWSTMTGMISMERLEPLRSSLLALGPFIRSGAGAGKTTHAELCDATWETAMIEMQMWSPSHTGGIVEGSIDAVLHQLTFLAPSPEILCQSDTAKSVQPHVDWFLRYLDAAIVPDSEAPWVTLYAYKAFMIAWQLVRGGTTGAMQVVGVRDGDLEGAMAWARKVFGRRERWQLGKVIMSCLDTLEK